MALIGCGVSRFPVVSSLFFARIFSATFRPSSSAAFHRLRLRFASVGDGRRRGL